MNALPPRWFPELPFPMLGLQPALGRLCTPDDNRTASGGPLAVRGYEYWQSRFGGDTTIIGTQMD
jgi:hypothetical protein